MIGLAIKFGPYAAIAVFVGLLALSHARNNALEARIDEQRAEYEARAAQANAEASRVALQELDRAVREERERWQELVTESNQAAADAEQERIAAERRADELAAELETLYRSDPDAEAWAFTRIPPAVRERLRGD